MGHKNTKARFLHNHPGTERDKNIDLQHVIVDRDDWNKAKRFHKMHETLKAIVNAQYEKGGTLARLNGAVSNARDLLKEIES